MSVGDWRSGRSCEGAGREAEGGVGIVTGMSAVSRHGGTFHVRVRDDLTCQLARRVASRRQSFQGSAEAKTTMLMNAARGNTREETLASFSQVINEWRARITTHGRAGPGGR